MGNLDRTGLFGDCHPNGTLLPPKSLRHKDSTTSSLNDKIPITEETRQHDHANFLQPSWTRPPPFFWDIIDEGAQNHCLDFKHQVLSKTYTYTHSVGADRFLLKKFFSTWDIAYRQ